MLTVEGAKACTPVHGRATRMAMLEPSLMVHPDDSAAGGRGITRAQVRGHHWAEASTQQSASLRTEAHLTRKSSEVAHGVLSRIIKKKSSFLTISGNTACLN